MTRLRHALSGSLSDHSLLEEAVTPVPLLSLAPIEVRRDAARIHAATGAAVDLEQNGGEWRLMLANQKMSLTLHYGRNEHGGFGSTGCVFIVDGERRPRPKSCYSITAAYHDVDEDGSFARMVPSPMPSEREIEQAPTTVQQIFAGLGGLLMRGEHHTVGLVDGHTWVIGITGIGCYLRYYFTAELHKAWTPCATYGLQVVAGGEDLSARAVAKSLKTITAMLDRHSVPGVRLKASGGSVTPRLRGIDVRFG